MHTTKHFYMYYNVHEHEVHVHVHVHVHVDQWTPNAQDTCFSDTMPVSRAELVGRMFSSLWYARSGITFAGCGRYFKSSQIIQTIAPVTSVQLTRPGIE